MKRLGLVLLLAAGIGCASAPVPASPASPVVEGTWVHAPPPEALPASASTPARVTVRRLATGLRVVIVEHRRRPVVATRLIFSRGAAADSDEDGGLTYTAVAMVGDFYEKKATGEEIVEEKSFRHLISDAGGAYSFEVGLDYSSVGIRGFA